MLWRPLILLVTLTALAAPATVGAAAAVHPCKSGDLRFPFRAGGPKDFGVFKLRISGGTCATAHRVAKAWMKKFDAGKGIPRSAAGFTFTNLPAHHAQELRERGKRGLTTVSFDYRVPSG